jgi:hypothetical protein
MHLYTKLGLYLSFLGGLTFMTGMISYAIAGGASGQFTQFFPACIFGGLIFFFVGLILFGLGVYQEEITKTKNELKK